MRFFCITSVFCLEADDCRLYYGCNYTEGFWRERKSKELQSYGLIGFPKADVELQTSSLYIQIHLMLDFFNLLLCISQ